MKVGRDINERSNTLFAAVLGSGAVLVGTLLVFGSGGPTNELMRELAPLDLWGVLFITAGMAGLLGQVVYGRMLIAFGHFCGAILCGLVAACFYVAATSREVHASLHGAGVYLTVAVLHLLVAMISRPPR